MFAIFIDSALVTVFIDSALVAVFIDSALVAVFIDSALIAVFIDSALIAVYTILVKLCSKKIFHEMCLMVKPLPSVNLSVGFSAKVLTPLPTHFTLPVQSSRPTD